MSQPRHILTILAVSDLQRARGFYEHTFGWPVVVDVPVFVQFELPGGMALGVYSREAFAANTEILPTGVPDLAITGTEIYLHVDDPAASLKRALDSGGRLLSKLAPRAWGDEAAYLADPEGNVIVLGRPLSE